jgi:hypothetical protein
MEWMAMSVPARQAAVSEFSTPSNFDLKSRKRSATETKSAGKHGKGDAIDSGNDEKDSDDDGKNNGLLAGREWVNARVSVVPYGVLGARLLATGAKHDVAKPPDSSAAIVDPAGLNYIQQGGPRGAGGASRDIYQFLGIQSDASFPHAVTESVRCHQLGRVFILRISVLLVSARSVATHMSLASVNCLMGVRRSVAVA